MTAHHCTSVCTTLAPTPSPPSPRVRPVANEHLLFAWAYALRNWGESEPVCLPFTSTVLSEPVLAVVATNLDGVEITVAADDAFLPLDRPTASPGGALYPERGGAAWS